MKHAILSDIHGNLDALEAVLASAKAEGVDEFLCLGDVVGYGAQPRECLDLVQTICSHVVAGNHDFAVFGRIETEFFNAHAKRSTAWTREQLGEERLEFLGSLPLVEHCDGFSIVHATLDTPELFGYVHSTYDAFLSLCRLPGDVCFIGHSHVPITFTRRRFITYSFESEVTIERGVKTLVNVGSVGQPRDNCPLAAYAIYDSTARLVCIRRVPYDVDAAAHKIREAGLPEILGERLKYGR